MSLETTPVYDDQAVTPSRDLRILFDVDETAMVSPAWELSKTAAQIGRIGQSGGRVGDGQFVSLVPGTPAYWELEQLQLDDSRLSEIDPGNGVVYRLTDVTTPPTGCIRETPLFQSRADIPGSAPIPAVQAAGDWWFVKDLKDGVDTSTNQLLNDSIQFPQPQLPSENYPMDRVLAGIQPDPPNCGYHFRFLVPAVMGQVPDTLCTFYFGGPQAPDNAGRYAVAFRGSGRAVVYHRFKAPRLGSGIITTGEEWRRVGRFDYCDRNGVVGRWHAITIRPRGKWTVEFEVASSGAADKTAGPDPSGGPHFDARPPNPHAARHIANSVVNNIRPGKFATGQGQVRLDIRRDLIAYFQISRSAFATLPDNIGILEDEPYIIPVPIGSSPGGSVPRDIFLELSGEIPQNTQLLARMFVVNSDLSQGPELTSQQLSPLLYRFTAKDTIQSYRVRYEFGTTDIFSSPRLFQAMLFLAPVYYSATGLNLAVTPSTRGGEAGGVTVTGPTHDPRHESASALISDLTGQAVLLRRRARMRSKIQIAYMEEVESKSGGLGPSSQVLISNLFEGEAAHIEGNLLGFDLIDYPSPDWRDFDISFVGMWARAEDSYNFYRTIFQGQGEFDPATGTPLPPYVTDVVQRVMFGCVGVPLNQLDIPQVAVRLAVASAGQAEEYMLHPRSRPIDFVQKLLTDYLGWVLFYDPNGGPLGSDGSPIGMWKARPDTDLFGAPAALWWFAFNPPVPQTLPQSPSPFPPGTSPQIGPAQDSWSYPPNCSFIQRPTYKDWVEPPEANAIFVLAPNKASELSFGAGQFKNTAILFNLASFNAVPGSVTATDRTHPDYLGRMVPYILLDPTLALVPDELGGPQGACNRLCSYIYDRIAHARKQFRFRAPLVLVADPEDLVRRPLRFNDPVMVNGFPAVLKCVSFDAPLQTSRQFAWYEGVFVGTGDQMPM